MRRRALGYDKFHVYDIKAPLTDSKPVVSFQQAVDWICEGMAPLGTEYVSILRRGCLEERWVDYACHKGKREGAFSSGSKGTRPFIMMSFGNDVFGVSTLAHELGHSLHSTIPARSSPSFTAATPSSWPRWPPTSTRPCCATTSSRPSPIPSSRLP